MMMPLDRVEERYRRDSAFRTLVDVLELQIVDLQLSPTEIREAAMFAMIRVEQRRPHRPMFLTPAEAQAILGARPTFSREDDKS